MERIWYDRLRKIAAGLFLAMLAAMGLAGILHAAGDSSGSQALCGAAVAIGVVFVADLGVLATGLGRIRIETGTDHAES